MIESYIKSAEEAKDIFIVKLKNIQARLEQELNSRIDQEKELSKQVEEYKKKTNDKLQSLDREYQEKFRELDGKTALVNEELSRLNVEKNRYDELSKNLKTTSSQEKEYLESIKSDKLKSQQILKNAEEKLKEYNQKLTNLKYEFDRLDKYKKEIETKEQVERLRKDENDDMAGQLLEKNEALKEKELDLAIKEKRIKFELKKLKLEE